MIDQFFRQPATAQRHRAAPLVGPYLDGVVGQLAALGYARTTVRRYIHACESFGRFLTVHGVELRDLSEAHVEAFLHEVASQRTWRGVPVDAAVRYMDDGVRSRCSWRASGAPASSGPRCPTCPASSRRITPSSLAISTFCGSTGVSGRPPSGNTRCTSAGSFGTSTAALRRCASSRPASSTGSSSSADGG